MPVRWSELPGFAATRCTRPGTPGSAAASGRARRSGAVPGGAAPVHRSADEQRAWMLQRLQPYRVEPLQAGAERC
jgi:membrane-bound lytic murein transglycosylase A